MPHPQKWLASWQATTGRNAKALRSEKISGKGREKLGRKAKEKKSKTDRKLKDVGNIIFILFLFVIRQCRCCKCHMDNCYVKSGLNPTIPQICSQLDI